MVLLAGAALVGYVTREEPEIFNGPTSIVARGDLVETTVVVGEIAPRTEVHVRPTITGILTEITVQAGDRVSQGQHVATVAPVADPVSLSNAQTRLARARLQATAAAREAERRGRRSAGGELAVSRQEFDRARDDVALAEAEVAAAQRELRLIARGTSRASGQASTRVISPMAGTVLDVPVVIGTFVSDTNSFRDGTSVAVVAAMDDLLFKGQVDEAHVGSLELGATIELRVGAHPEERIRARLEHIAPQATRDVDSRGVTTFEIWAALEAPSVSLRAGYSATAEITIDERRDALLVDEGTLTFEDGNAMVDVLAGGTLHRRAVAVGLSDGVRIEVLDGLSEGDEVAIRTTRE